MALTGTAAKALEALQTGKDVMHEVYGEAGKTVDYDDALAEAEEVTSDTGSLDTLLDGSEVKEPTAEDSNETGDNLSPAEESKDSEEGSEPSETSVEFISVTDHRGRKRKVKVDYSDKDSIKRAFSLAAGARKWQAEKDSLAKELSGFRDSVGKKVENWDAIESAYSDTGLKGLINFIEGREDAYDILLDNELQKRNLRAKASPEELALMDAEDNKLSQSRELEKLRKEMEELRQSSEANKSEAEMRSIESKINPVFDRYRFSGKLGDADQEHILDEMLWTRSLKNLEDYEGELTADLVQKEFRKTANTIRKIVNTQATKKADKTIKAQKRNAAENVQTKAMKGFKSSSDTEEAKSLIKNRNLTDLLKNWGKYGNVFNK